MHRLYRRLMGLALGRKPGRAAIAGAGNCAGQTTLNTAEMLESKDNGTVLNDLGLAKMLHCRVRYFTDGAVIGSKEFVNEAFARARERFSAKRKDGARARKTTLNQLFRNWLTELAGLRERDERLAALLDRLDYVKSGGPFSREDWVEPSSAKTFSIQ